MADLVPLDVSPQQPRKKHRHPFRRKVLRGLGVLLPPLLTVVIFVWIWTTVQSYVLRPVERGAAYVMLWGMQDSRTLDANEDPPEGYRRLEGTKYAIPEHVYLAVQGNDPIAHAIWEERGAKQQPRAYYDAYIHAEYLRPQIVIPVFLIAFIALMYLLGSFLAAGAGRVAWQLAERGLLSLPLVRNVYSSVKQVTDFMFSERELEFSRVVAVEYPRRGIWSIGFVTGESFQDIHSAANEPVLSILIPTSPMPVTGYTVNCLKSEVLDLNLTIDEALQYTISCGVVVPPHQTPQVRERTIPAPSDNGSEQDQASADGKGNGSSIKEKYS